MKRFFLVLVFVLAALPARAQTTPSRLVYVQSGASGGGTSWADAYGELRDALASAQAGDAIVVARGTYRPSGSGDEAVSFRMIDEVQIYGGFAGSESLSPATLLDALAARDFGANETILSGDYGGGTNAYHVVYALGVQGAPITRAAVLDGFTITGGAADGRRASYQATVGERDDAAGGGIFIQAEGRSTEAIPTLRDLIIKGNTAIRGGGVYLTVGPSDSSSDPMLVVSPLFTRVRVQENSAVTGGGLASGSRADGAATTLGFTFVDGAIQGNEVPEEGSAYSTGIGHNGTRQVNTELRVAFVNTLITGNVSSRGQDHFTSRGSVIYVPRRSEARDGTPDVELVQTTVAGNYITGRGGVLTVYGGAEIRVTNSIVWGNVVENGGATNNHFGGGVVAFEASVVQQNVDAGNTAADPLFADLPVLARWQPPTTLGDFRLTDGSAALDFGSASLLPADTADLDGDGDTSEPLPLDLAGEARVRGRAPDAGAYEAALTVLRPLVYVRQGASGSGTSWADAYGELRDALAAAQPGDAIVVARGTYLPSGSGDRTASFDLADGVPIYGGFSGAESLAPASLAAALGERDLATNETILSGDLAGDDVPGDFGMGRSDNSYHIVRAVSTDGSDVVTRSAVLDGFTIRGGEARVKAEEDEFSIDFNNFPNRGGGGIYLRTESAGSVVSPTLRRLIVEDNQAYQGGGIHMRQIRNASGSSPSESTLSPLFVAVTVRANVSRFGGGLAVFASDGATVAPVFVNLAVQGNRAQVGGGLLVNKRQVGSANVAVTVANALVTGNVVEGTGTGGGIYAGGELTLDFAHTTVAANTSDFKGGGFYLEESRDFDNNKETPVVRFDNGIAWGNVADISEGSLSGGYGDESRLVDPDFRYSVVQESVPGEGNVVANPRFVSPADATGAPTASGDFRLRTGSPALDHGLASLLPQDVGDLDGDENTSEPLPQDIAGALRVQDAAPDAGAYEGAFVVVRTLTYVRQGASGAGDGSSWADAFPTFAEALAATGDDATFVLARGTYMPSTTGDRTAAFDLESGAEVYGGFAGTELLDIATLDAALDARDLVSNQTVLSGDLAGNDMAGDLAMGRGDNSAHVVRFVSGVGGAEPIVLDGVTIRGGHADGSGPENNIAYFARDAQPCEASDGHGGGLCIGLRGGTGALTLRRVTLEDNFASAYGGGAFLVGGDDAVFTVTIDRATVQDNAVPRDDSRIYGGGLYLGSEDGRLDVTVRRSTFRRNAAARGGAIYVETDDADGSLPESDATLTTTLLVSESTFADNLANGAAIALGSSGGSGSFGTLPDIVTVDARVVASRFESNSAVGTAVAGASGGALALIPSNNGYVRMRVESSLIAGNIAEEGEGGAAVIETFRDSYDRAELYLDGVTVAGNQQFFSSAALYLNGPGALLDVRNSILWGNTDPSGAANLVNQYVVGDAGQGDPTARFEHSLIQGSGGSGDGWTPSRSPFDPDVGTFIDAGGNLDADPLFENPGDGADAPFEVAGTDLSYRVLPGSPVLDAGTLPLPEDAADLDGDGITTEPLPLDLLGNPRLVGDLPDLGAIEGPVVVDAPTANDDAYTGVEDEVLVVSGAEGVLANDDDGGERPTEAELFEAPAFGTLTIGADGGFTYVPVADTTGTFTFRYRADGSGGFSDPATVTITLAGTPDDPVAVSDAYEAQEDTPLQAGALTGVLANDRDPDGDNLDAILVPGTGPFSGTLDFDEDTGGFTYTPDPGFFGQDRFEYVARDPSGRESEQVDVIINVAFVDDPPIARDLAYRAEENTPLVVEPPGLLDGVTDEEEVLEEDCDETGCRVVRQVSVFYVDGPANGTVDVRADGGFTYTPTLDYFGVDTFRYGAEDTAGLRDTATVTITVVRPERPPVALGDSYGVVERETLEVDAPGVLANDTEPNGQAITAVLEREPARGTLTLSPNGGFTYVHQSDLDAADSFAYRARDSEGGLSDSVTVVIEVSGRADAPVGVPDTYTFTEDTRRFIPAPGVRANDSDPDGPTPNVVFEGTDAVPGILLTDATGALDYTPAQDTTGTFTFGYRLFDPLLGPGDLVAVTFIVEPVNDAPSLTGASTFDYPSGGEAVTGLPVPVTDVDGDALTTEIVTAPTGGTLDLADDGSFTFTPDAGFFGTASFAFRFADLDGATTGTVTVTIRVTLGVIARDDAYAGTEDELLARFSRTTGVLANDEDPGGGTLTAAVATEPASGTLNFDSDGTFSYRPVENFFGEVTFTYEAIAEDGRRDTATVSLTFEEVVEPPVVNIDNQFDRYTVREDETLVVDGTTFPSVLANDDDPDSDILTAQLVSTGGIAESVTLNDDGTFTFVPEANRFGNEVAFTYRAVDGDGNTSGDTGTPVIIDVTPVNDAPIAEDDGPFLVAEDGALTIGASRSVLGNDTDVDGDALIAVYLEGDGEPANGTLTARGEDGSFTYVPDPNFDGTDSFTYRVQELRAEPGGGTTRGEISAPATVTIEVLPVTDRPILVADTFFVEWARDTPLPQRRIEAPGLLANDFDPEGDGLAVSTVQLSETGAGRIVSFDAEGGFVYEPALQFTGEVSGFYQVRAGGSSPGGDPGRFVLRVSSRPEARRDVSQRVDEDDVLEGQIFDPSDTSVFGDGLVFDEDGQMLTARVTAESTEGILTLDPATGAFTYAPTPDFFGADSFTVVVTDAFGFESDPITVPITVRNVNDAPIGATDREATATEDQAEPVRFDDLTAGVTDIDSDPPFGVIVAQQPVGGSATVEGGVLLYRPAADFFGTDVFRYAVTDGDGAQVEAQITVEVAPAPDAPRPVDDSYTVAEDTPLVIEAPGVLANDVEVDGEALGGARVVEAPANGTVDLAANGGFTYTPAADFFGTDTFRYATSDPSRLEGEATVTIDVTPAPDAPRTAPDTYTVAEDSTITIPASDGLFANDLNVDTGDRPTSLAGTSGQRPGFLWIVEADGGFSFTPPADASGTFTFGYQVRGALGEVSETETVTFVVEPRPDAPVAFDVQFQGQEDTPLVVDAPGVLISARDADGDELRASVVEGEGPRWGTLDLSANGGFTFVPAPDSNGTVTFRFRVTDDSDATLSTEATARLIIAPLLDAGRPADDAYTGTEDVVLSVSATGGVLANDDDPDGAGLTAEVATPPAQGTLDLRPDGSFDFAAPADSSGTFTFTYRTVSALGTSEPATVTLTIAPAPDAPLALADAYDGVEDETLTVALEADGVLANDRDPDGDALAVTFFDAPEWGTLDLAADGTFTFVPAADSTGTVTFRYRVTDDSGEALSDETTVTLAIAPRPDAPVAAADVLDALQGVELDLDAPGILANDTDVDGDLLRALLVEDVENGSLDLAEDGSLIYTSDLLFSGEDRFIYRATDGAFDSEPVTVVIRVAPNADLIVTADPDTYSTPEDTALTIPAPGVLANDVDASGDALVATLVEDVDAAQGTLAFGTDGGFTFTPALDFFGEATFVYRASDPSGIGDTARVVIAVTPVNDAPVAVVDSFVVVEDSPLNVAAPGVLANDTDVENSPLEARLAKAPANGTVEIAEDGGFRYVPAPDFFGEDRFGYVASDGDAESDTAFVIVEVLPADDLPRASADAYEVAEDAVLTVDAPGVLANDDDPDGGALEAALIAAPENGTLDLASNGGFTYTPDADFTGADDFTYRAANADTASAPTSVSITVTPIADPPVAADDLYRLAEDTPFAVDAEAGVLANDTDADGDALEAELVEGEGPRWGTLDLAGDGSFSFTPAADSSGTVSFTYEAVAEDGRSRATVTLDVLPETDAPIAADDAYSGEEDTVLEITPADGVLANDRSPDGDTLTARLVDAPRWGTLELADNGGFTFAPAPDSSGTVTFTYEAVAADGTDRATVTLTIATLADAPVAVNDDYAAVEDTPLMVDAENGVLANDADADGDSLFASVVEDAGPRWGTLDLARDGSFTFIPAPDSSGMVSFTYEVTDGTLTDRATVTLTVSGEGDGPVASDDAYDGVEDTVLEIATADGVLANDTDADGDDLVAVLVEAPRWGTLDLMPDGSFAFTPAPDSSGTVSFTYDAVAADGTDRATVTLTIAPLADAPLALDDGYDLSEDETLTVSAAEGVLANDTDADGDALTAELDEDVAQGTLDFASDGSFTYAPPQDFTGEVTFRYAALDAVGEDALRSVATVTLRIGETDDPPVAVADSYDGEEDVVLEIALADGVLANDTDTDGDDLAAVLVEAPRWGTLDLMPDGAFTFTPASDSSGTVTFTYAAQAAGAESVATVTLAIAPVADAPLALDDAYEGIEDAPLAVSAADGVLANDTDADGDALRATLVEGEGPRWGTLDLATDGSFTFTPAADSSGTVTFTYEATDGTLTGRATVTLDVNADGDAPVAAADAYDGTEDNVLEIDAADGVLANDADADGDDLTVTLAEAPRWGVLDLAANGSFTFAPAPDSSGTVSFTYDAIATDGSSRASVTLTIAAVNDAPVAIADTGFVQLGSSVTVDVLANDADVEDDALTLTSVSSVAEGTVTFEPDGQVTFTPGSDAEGLVEIAYTVRDAQGAESAGVLRVTIITSVYTVADLGTLGGEGARAFDIDDAGRVVGVAQDASGAVRPFFWDGQTMRLLGEASGQAFALDGQAIAGLTESDSDVHAALWNAAEPGAGPTRLSPSFSMAYDLAGPYAAGAVLDGDRFRATLWSGGGETRLATPGTAHSQALGVNVRGQSAGVIEDDQAQRGALWRPDGTLLRDESDARFADVNTAGLTVGQAEDRAALWPEDGARTFLTETTATQAFAVNDAGTVVGGRMGEASAKRVHPVLDPRHDPHARQHAVGASPEARAKRGAAVVTGAFVWERGFVTDLNDALRDAPDGLDLVEARAINGAGQIVGYAVREGVPRAVVLTPASNRSPSARPDRYVAFPGQAMRLDVLANDADPDGDSLFVSFAVAEGAGRVEVTDGDALVYTAPEGFVGMETLTYVVLDGRGGASRAAVEMTVEAVPTQIRLEPPYPNPAHARAHLRYVLPETGSVQVEVYDATGRRVAHHDLGSKEPGSHEAVIATGTFASGVYLVRLTAGESSTTRRLVVLR